MPLTETNRPAYPFLAAWALMHIALVLGLAALLRYTLEGQALGQAQFLHWDASWQDNLRQQGYVFQANSQSNLAFFPLFPQLWHWLGLSPMGIGLANALLYGLSLAALAWQLGFRYRTFALSLAAPCLVFFALPYSEALFFAFAVLALLGLDKKQP